MATIVHISPLTTGFRSIVRRFSPGKTKFVTACKSVIKSSAGISLSPEPIIRRSGNYQPCMWDNKFLQSLKSGYAGENSEVRASELKEVVEFKLKNVVDPLDQLELIDHLQKLGVDYHFHDEIERALKNIYSNTDKLEKNLHATALRFRLLRGRGYDVSQEDFKGFTENERFKECLGEDVKGILSLYEASYYSIEGESLIEEACSFTTKILKERVNNIDDSYLSMQVKHSLELPLQWRIPRFEARWYMDLYENSDNIIPEVLKLAKLDFNIVQGLNQEELKELSRWWDRTSPGNKLEFARDRLAASFLWGVGITSLPQHGYCRLQITKAIQIISVIDDVYDVYGTLEELELFTKVIERWDITAMEELPDYMKICFLALYNSIHEMAYDILKEKNLDVLAPLSRTVINLLKHYLVEARWYHSGYKPTLDEYLNNASTTISGPVMAIQSYICTANPIKKEAMKYIEEIPDIVRLASEIFRLADDYGTSSDELARGDVPKSIQCYMNDTGVSEEVARKHMKGLMKQKWAKLIQCRYSKDYPLSWSFVEIILNLVRTSHCVYNAGNDGFGVEDEEALYSLFIEPIPLQ
ncbi:Monoterpene synthase [Heracleum sosnowskyi]|uniref:Monoterpene synthase n=1 Tax=Heracleum sosnowskyi TaxID=360622 RepID=A0AAD8HZ99_9APIA|nr:Monoterpene synthase [Heracleum sosnowskyi]